MNFKLVVFLILSGLIPIKAQLSESFTVRSAKDSIYQKELQIQNNIEKGDTLEAINTLLELGMIHSHRAQFAYAYEILWKALSMTNAINDSISLYKIYEQLGWLYSYYNRLEEAKAYYNKSIGIVKQLIKSGKLKPKYTILSYYGFATLYREQSDLSLSKKYIDSCLMVIDMHNVEEDRAYVNAELAYYYLLSMKNYAKAISMLKDAEPWFKENQMSYLVILYSFLGDAYYAIGDVKQSEHYYNKALTYADKYIRHLNYIPRIYLSLSKMYFNSGELEKAYTSLQTSKEYDDLLFDSRSINNRSLLEISDKFKLEQKLRMELVQKQRISELEHQKKVSYYRNLIMFIIIMSIILLGYWGRRAAKIKYKNEKVLASKKLELEHKHNKDILDNKNKELAFTALQLFEKDKMLNSLKDKLLGGKNLPGRGDIERIFQSISLNANQNWEAFEARFIETNNDFYTELIKLYPELTPGELKLCALLKLNFSSKEIANLLGVGNDSVNTLRHRLRKKIGLTRSDNITKFLNSIS